MKIAVLLDDEDNAVSFDDGGTIKIYSDETGKWQVINEMRFVIDSSLGMKDIRDKIRSMAEKLGNCRIFAAQDVTGLTYNILEGMEYNIWRVSGKPMDFLEYIAENERKEEKEAAPAQEIPAPVEKCEKGCYFIDLRQVMESNEKVTSKQVLLPFFHKKAFLEIEILCSHIPPWFEHEFRKLGFKAVDSKIEENKYLVRVYNEN